MADDVKLPAEKTPRMPTLYFIVGFKLLKGTLALLLALGFYSLTDNNLPEEFQKLLMFLHLDPEKKFFLDLADRVADVTPTNLRWAATGAVIYGAFMLLQALGLGLRVSWIVWLVIGESAFFVPIELFELVHHPSWLKFFILAANGFIVWYLFVNRARLIKHPAHPVAP
ncbi:MAG: hypothetical protein RLZZ350_1193 [Verrucomicrobiota bacterium]|jgi:uncharacterized membrane protein (DUF2068 family)